MKIGILAYGSLINDPGEEIRQIEKERRTGLKTPFRVEFARKSVSSRGGAPTLVPVTKGGAYVNATLIVLKQGTKLNIARDMLYRREVNEVGSEKKYSPDPIKTNQVYIEVIPDWGGMDFVLYTRIEKNIKDPLAPKRLAKLAIKSVQNAPERDGITYLINAKLAGIKTTLSQQYEEEILRQTNSKTLQDALIYVKKYLKK